MLDGIPSPHLCGSERKGADDLTTVTLLRLLTAAAIGIAYYCVTVLVWGYIGAYNPVNKMLLEVFVHQEHRALYRVLISLHDVIVNLVVALPFAAAFRFIPALRSWTYVALATAASVIAIYGSINIEALPLLLGHWQFWYGLALAVFSLPVAFTLLNKIRLGSVPPSRVQDAV